MNAKSEIRNAKLFYAFPIPLEQVSGFLQFGLLNLGQRNLPDLLDPSATEDRQEPERSV